jgi:hypothetical protein
VVRPADGVTALNSESDILLFAEVGNFAAIRAGQQRFTPRSIPDIFAKRQPTLVDIA